MDEKTSEKAAKAEKATKTAKTEKSEKIEKTEEVVETEETEAKVEQHKKYEFIEDIPGVGPATAEKLTEMGYHTVESLATAAIKELTEVGVGEKQAAKVIAEARDSIALSFVRADELLKMRQNIRRLTTASKQIDELLGGGLETQTITEFYGEYGVGKSILSHQLWSTFSYPKKRVGLTDQPYTLTPKTHSAPNGSFAWQKQWAWIQLRSRRRSSTQKPSPLTIKF